MNIEKAIETLKDMRSIFGERSHNQYSLPALDLAISALEKQKQIKEYLKILNNWSERSKGEMKTSYYEFVSMLKGFLVEEAENEFRNVCIRRNDRNDDIRNLYYLDG
jgi:hypothetical protein